MTKLCTITLVGVALACAQPGCKGKSDKKTKKTAPAPKLTKPTKTKPTKAKAKKPKVRGKSVDWATLAKKQPKAKTPAKGKVSAKTVPKAKHHQPLATLKTIKPTGLRAVYVPSKDKNYDAYRLAFQEERIFDVLAEEFNKVYKLPRVVDIQMTDCGVPNAFYDDESVRIIICYELLAYFLDRFEPTTKNNDDLGTKVIGATLFIFFHELGHALKHQLELPLTGNEEDAVDELATLTLIGMDDIGLSAAFAAAEWFALEGDKLAKNSDELPFWDEHSLEPKRFYNVLCLVYGSDPATFEWMKKDDILPERRAGLCAKDFTAKEKAWNTLLAKHVRPQAPASAKPTGGGPPCPVIANHVARLTRQAFRKNIAKISPADQEAEKKLFVPKLNNFKQSVLLDCRDTKWTPAERKCVLKTTKLDDLDACDAETTDKTK